MRIVTPLAAFALAGCGALFGVDFGDAKPRAEGDAGPLADGGGLDLDGSGGAIADAPVSDAATFPDGESPTSCSDCLADGGPSPCTLACLDAGARSIAASGGWVYVGSDGEVDRFDRVGASAPVRWTSPVPVTNVAANDDLVAWPAPSANAIYEATGGGTSKPCASVVEKPDTVGVSDRGDVFFLSSSKEYVAWVSSSDCAFQATEYNPAVAMALSPNGTILAYAGHATSDTTLFLYTTSTAAPAQFPPAKGQPAGIEQIAVDDAATIFFFHDGTVFETTGTCTTGPPASCPPIATVGSYPAPSRGFAVDTTRVWLASSTEIAWHAKTGAASGVAFSGETGLDAMAVDDTYVYWTVAKGAGALVRRGAKK